MTLTKPSQRFKQEIYHRQKLFASTAFLCRTLARKCKKKRENVAEKRPGPTPVLGEATEKDLIQWALTIQKQGLPVGRDMILRKAQEIHRYMYGSTHSIGSVGCGWCDRFIIQHHELTLRTARVIKRARNEASWRVCRASFASYVST